MPRPATDMTMHDGSAPATARSMTLRARSTARRWVGAIALLLCTSSLAVGNAQEPLPLAPARETASSGKAQRPLPDQLRDARAQLAEAQRQRDDSIHRGGGKSLKPLPTNKRRLLDWIVDLQGEKVKRLEDLLALQNSPYPGVEEDPAVKALAGPPPYAAPRVDALRDEIDGLKENLAAAEARLAANKTEIQNLKNQLEGKAAAARVARDRALAASAGGATSIAAEDREIAALLHQVAEAELSVALLDQESLQHRMAFLNARIRDLEAVVTRVLPAQRLSLADLEAQRQQVRSAQERLAAEGAAVSGRYLRHHAARDSLGDAGRTAGGQTTRQAALLDLAIRTDNATLKGLEDLQLLNAASGDFWEQRYLVSSGANPEQRRAALAALSELGQKLGDWRGLSRTRQEALRTEIREQRMRIDNLAPHGRGPEDETQRLGLLLQQAAMEERVELAAARLERQASRGLSDLAATRDRSFASRIAWLRELASETLTRIWNQELFVAEDTSEVDGRRLSVPHSVTVGKSVGIVFVFTLGYWLLSRLARFFENLLIRRFRVSPQQASVARRWFVIVLCTALMVLVLNLARIPLSVFAFMGGALAIGVGFGTQTIIKNLISGLIVLFERKVRVGDVVELGGIVGHVTAVDLRATTVCSFNGVEALVPNANFIENQVVNWTHSNRSIRHEVSVGVAYGSDVGQAEALFLAAAAEHPQVLADPAPEVFLEEFGDSALKLVLVFWVELNDPVAPRRVDSDLRRGIYRRLAEAGIVIAFPQQDVHVRLVEPVPLPTTHPRGAIHAA